MICFTVQGRRLLAAMTAVGLAAWTSVQAQESLPRVPGASVITVTPPGVTGDEEVIAVNRYSPNELVMTYGGRGGGSAAYSSDSGRTWTLVNPAAPGHMGGNKSVAFDDRGDVFIPYQLIEKLGSPGYWGHNA